MVEQRRVVIDEVDHGLVKPYLGLEKLDIVNGLLQQGDSIHLCSAGDQALQYLEPIADAMPPLSSRHALWVGGELHPFASLPILLLIFADGSRQ